MAILRRGGWLQGETIKCWKNKDLTFQLWVLYTSVSPLFSGLVDRASRYLVARKLDAATADATERALYDATPCSLGPAGGSVHAATWSAAADRPLVGPDHRVRHASTGDRS